MNKTANGSTTAQSQTITNLENKVSMTVQVYDGLMIVHEFDLSTFPKGIGSMAAKISDKVEFEFLGRKFTLPALTSGNCNADRCAKVYRDLVTNFFPAEMQLAEELDKTSKEAKVILSLQKAGFKFKRVSKAAVKEAIEAKISVWKQKAIAHRIETRLLNADLIEESKFLKAENKAQKVVLVKAIESFTDKRQKAIAAEVVS